MISSSYLIYTLYFIEIFYVVAKHYAQVVNVSGHKYCDSTSRVIACDKHIN